MEDLKIGCRVEVLCKPRSWDSHASLDLECPLYLVYPHMFEIVSVDITSDRFENRSGQLALKSLQNNKVYGFSYWGLYDKNDCKTYRVCGMSFNFIINKELGLESY